MRDEKFTQGPWKFSPDADEDEFPIVSYEATGDGDEVEICQVNTFITKNYESPGELDMDRVIANARLIISAPDMVDAIVEQCETCEKSVCGVCSLGLALYKAGITMKEWNGLETWRVDKQGVSK